MFVPQLTSVLSMLQQTERRANPHARLALAMLTLLLLRVVTARTPMVQLVQSMQMAMHVKLPAAHAVSLRGTRLHVMLIRGLT